MPEQEKPRADNAAARQAEEREDLIAAYLGGGMSPEMAAAFERCMGDDLALAAEVEATREALAAAREWLAIDPPGLARAEKVEVPILARRRGGFEAPQAESATVARAAEEREAEIGGPRSEDKVNEVIGARSAVEVVSQPDPETGRECDTGAQPVIHGQDAHATPLIHGQDAHATAAARIEEQPAAVVSIEASPAAAVTEEFPREAKIVSAMEAASARRRAPRRFWGWQAAAAALVFGVGVLVGRSPELREGEGSSAPIGPDRPSAQRTRLPMMDPAGGEEAERRVEGATAPTEKSTPSERTTPPAPKGKRLAAGEPDIRTTVEKDGRIVIETTLRGNGAPATWVVDGAFRLAQAGESTWGEE